MTKRWMLIALLLGAATVEAQQGPARRPGVGGRLPVDSPRVSGQRPGATPRAPGHGFGLLPPDQPTPPMAGQGFGLPPMEPPTPATPPTPPEPTMPSEPPMPSEPAMPPTPRTPPIPPEPPMGFWQGQGQGSGQGRGLGQSREQLQELLKEQSRIDQSLFHDMRLQDWNELSLLGDQMHLMELDAEHAFGGFGLNGRKLDERMRAPWAQGDAADSVYRSAFEMVNRGEWRRASQVLRDIPQRYPNSAYASEALYWQAYSLYRIGGNTDLQQALEALATLKNKYPTGKRQGDVQTLVARIQGTLASRGDAKAASDLARSATDNPQTCDREDQMVKTEALNQLSRMDPDNFSSMMRSVLARKDECSVPLRKNVVYIVGNKRDAGAAATLVAVAKNDPSIDVRAAAIDWLARIPSEEGLATLAEFAKSTSEDERIQRSAVRALAVHPSEQARQLIRSIVERNDVPDRLRSEALSAFDKERTTADDVAWLRTVYSKLDNRQLKQRALAAIVRVSGSESDQFLMNIVKDDNESSELRSTALRRIGQTMSIADIGKMYDAAAAQTVRSSLIEILGSRKEPEATDKLLEIAKKGTDPNLITQSFRALANKNDPRTVKLLQEIINKP